MEYMRDTAGRRQRAVKTLLSLRPCTSKEHLEPTILQIETLLSELRGTQEFPTLDMLCVIIKKTFSCVPSLAALFAAADLQGWLRPGTGAPMRVLEAIRKFVLDGRDELVSAKEFQNKDLKKDDKNKAMAAAEIVSKPFTPKAGAEFKACLHMPAQHRRTRGLHRIVLTYPNQGLNRE
jgi:hypothetical protein